MIENRLRQQLKNITGKYAQIEKVILFGSRARGDYNINSDVDICLIGSDITHLILAKVCMDIDELDTPLSFDILNFNELSKTELIYNSRWNNTKI